MLRFGRFWKLNPGFWSSLTRWLISTTYEASPPKGGSSHKKRIVFDPGLLSVSELAEAGHIIRVERLWIWLPLELSREEYFLVLVFILVRSVFRKSAFLPTFSLSSFWLNSYKRDCYVSGLRCSRFVRTLRVLPTWLLVFVRVHFQAALFYPF